MQTSPRVGEQNCLIGLRTFLGVQRMFHTPNLILLARISNSPLNEIKFKSKSKEKNQNSTKSTSSWTLYSLKMSPAGVLYKDFIELTANNKTGLTELLTSQNSDCWVKKLLKRFIPVNRTIFRLATPKGLTVYFLTHAINRRIFMWCKFDFFGFLHTNLQKRNCRISSQQKKFVSEIFFSIASIGHRLKLNILIGFKPILLQVTKSRSVLFCISILWNGKLENWSSF